MRAGRLVELLLLLQLRGRASAPELAAALEVSVRTVYRDIEALSAAGVPVYAEPGRGGGIRLQAGYRVGGVPHMDVGAARGLALAAVPGAAAALGLDPATGDEQVLGSMDAAAEEAARTVRDRVLIEPDEWWATKEPVPFLVDVAHGVWEARELRLTYRSASGRAGDRVIQPLGLVLKGDTWYLLARSRGGHDRMYRVSRIAGVVVLPHRFERPAGFSLADAWAARKSEFAASIPTYFATVRVAPEGEPLLHLLQEGTPPLPLPTDIPRDGDGWATLRLRFERPASAARLLLQLGAAAEVVDPPELRDLMVGATKGLAELYG